MTTAADYAENRGAPMKNTGRGPCVESGCDHCSYYASASSGTDSGIRSHYGSCNRRAAHGPVRPGAMAASAETAETAVIAGQASLPWHCLYFLPLPQGQGSLRPTRTPSGSASSSSAWPPAVVSTPPLSVGAV